LFIFSYLEYINTNKTNAQLLTDFPPNKGSSFHPTTHRHCTIMSSGQEVGTIFGKGTGPATALLRSPTVLIATIALWGMNVCLFRLFGIDYIHVLTLDLKKQEEERKKRRRKIKGGAVHVESKPSEDHNEEPKNYGSKKEEGDSREYSDDEDDELIPISLEDSVSKFSTRNSPHLEITEVKLLGLSVLLMVTLYTTYFVWIRIGRGSTIGAIFCFYALVATGIMLPIPSTAWVRLACTTVLYRAGELLKPRCSCIHGKPRSVPFIDVFFADAMCSMSKVSL
jgi:EXS family.